MLATLACSYIGMVRLRLLHPKRRQSVVECVLWKISIGYCRMQVGLLKDMFFYTNFAKFKLGFIIKNIVFELSVT